MNAEEIMRDTGKCPTCGTQLAEKKKCQSDETPTSGKSGLVGGSVAWISFNKKPKINQPILVYRKKQRPDYSFQVIRYYPGDENEFDYWAELSPPKQ